MTIGRAEVVYGLLMLVATALGVVRSVVFGAEMAPSEMGYYSIVLTVSGYVVFVQLGLMSGLTRELPVSLGRGEEERATQLVGETSVSVLAIQFLGVLLYLALVAQLEFDDPTMRVALLFAGVLALSTPFTEMALLRLRAEQKVLVFSVARVLNSLAIVIIGAATISYWGYKGPIAVIVVANLTSFFVISRWLLGPVDYGYFNVSDIAYLIKIGLPIMGVGLLANLRMSMDRLFLIRTGTAADIGIYQIGAIPVMFGILASGIVNQYVGPKLLHRYGQGRSLLYVFKRSVSVALVIVGAMIAALPLVYFGARFVVATWLPAYQESLPLIAIMYLGTIFTAANVTGVVIIAANRPRWYLAGAGIVTLVSAAAYLVVAHTGGQLHSYAYVNSGMQFIGFVVVTATAYCMARSSLPT